MPVATRQLPGVRFETQAPPTPQILPRMDIAGFVGFASSGPVHVPVPVEDPGQFAALFGPDPPLAWDAERGGQGYAYLGPAVRSFFRNGGRRCWVVRVASLPEASPPDPDGVTDRFPLGGVAQLRADGSVGPAQLIARSPGSWADALTVSTSLEVTPLRIGTVSTDPQFTCEAFIASPNDIDVGELVRLEVPGGATALLFVVSAVDSVADEPLIIDGARLHRVVLESGLQLWIHPVVALGSAAGTVEYTGAGAVATTVTATVSAGAPAGLIALDLGIDAPAAPPPGSLVHGVFAAQDVWISVEEIEAIDPTSTLMLGTAFEVSPLQPSSPPWGTTIPVAAKLELAVQVSGDPNGQMILGGLGFAPAHPRFLGTLPTDAALYGEQSLPTAGLAADALNPRFSLAAPTDTPALYVPLATSVVAAPALPPIRPAGSERARDGLESFHASAFVDPDLASTDAGVLISQAGWIRDQAPSPRPLRGIHALLAIDEVTILSVPDAVQRGWSGVGDVGSDGTYEAPLAPPPQPDWSQFLACTTAVLTPPELLLNGDPGSGTFTLTWSQATDTDALYELQQATLADFTDVATIYQGGQREFSLYGTPAGSTLRFRVRALSGGNVSGWSQTLVVALPAPDRWMVIPERQYDSSGLLATQLAMLRMCAARGDMLAVLSLPERYRARGAVAHVSALKGAAGPSGGPPDPIFSYGAAYHPWVYAADPASPGSIGAAPPEGAIAGVIAARSTARGPWIAPANQPLRDALALDPAIGADAYGAMLDAQVNLVRQDPRGFLCLTADTLSETDELLPIGVRRLLAALHRLALLQGSAYAFEPNADVFSRAVERDLEQLLTRLWALGAFAGSSTTDSFRVTTTTQPDAGRLTVEIAVAPSLPLSFLTVRLLRGPNGTFSVQGA